MGLFSNHKNLRSTLVTSLMSTYLVPILIILLLVFGYTWRDTRVKTLAELQTMSESKAELVSKFLAERLQRSMGLANEPTLTAFISDLELLKTSSKDTEQEELHREIISSQGIGIKQLFIQDGFNKVAVYERNQGTLLFDYNLRYQDLGKSIRDEDATKNDRILIQIVDMVRNSGLPVAMDAYKSGSIEQSIVYYGVPVYDKAGVFTHVLLTGHSLEQINLLVSMDYGQYVSRDTVLANDEAIILTQPRNPTELLSLGLQSEHQLILKALKDFPKQESSIFYENSERLYGAYSPVRTDRIASLQTKLTWVVVSQMSAAQVRQTIVNELAIIFTVILLVGIGVFFFARRLAGSIAKPIVELTQSVDHLAKGDLTQVPQSKRQDEIGLLMQTTATMVTQWRVIMERLKETIATTSQISSTVFSSVEQQSAISVEQAGSITEISSTMDEFTSSFSQVSESVGEVSNLSTEIYQRIVESSNLIDSVAEKMRDINDDNTRDIDYITQLKTKSKDISKIMEIINSISDQTKIISFNAALEASSAGEAGKRFSVVASEIRKLTEDVIHSTSHIDTLVTEIQNLSDKMVLASDKTTKNISHGLEAADDSVQNIELIVGSIKRSNEATKQIVLAVQQQQTAAQQIQGGLKELSEGAQQNSEAINAISESDSEYRSVTDTLSTIISGFKTRDA